MTRGDLGKASVLTHRDSKCGKMKREILIGQGITLDEVVKRSYALAAECKRLYELVSQDVGATPVLHQRASVRKRCSRRYIR